MFALGIHYLMGWAMAAADGAKKQRPEWPPHPDRVFMALAAAWFETGQEEDEGIALRLLENFQPPMIAASDATNRQVLTTFVPVNDDSAPIKKDGKNKWKAYQTLEGLSIGRNRQPRSFPVAIPHSPFVHLIWHENLPEKHACHLANLCQKVISVGHSASLVQMWLTHDSPQANWVPVSGFARVHEVGREPEKVEARFRIPGPGRLGYLEARCNRRAVIEWGGMNSQINEAQGQRKKQLQQQISEAFPGGRPVSLRPEAGLWQGYGRPAPVDTSPVPGSLFDPRLIVLSLSGKKLSLSATLRLTEALRGTLLKDCPAPMPEWVSGHAPDGARTAKPHLAILPLSHVGNAHADGRLMGMALCLPREVGPTECIRILDPWLRDEHGMPRRISLFDGKWFECAVELDTRESPPWNLRPETWTGPARVWSSVTPVVLDRHFDGKDKWEKASESVKDGCERIGLPRPEEVLLHPVSMFAGVPRSNEFPWLTRTQDGGRMHHDHAVIVFGQKVHGPVVVGAGRFRGYGLCRPLAQGGEAND